MPLLTTGNVDVTLDSLLESHWLISMACVEAMKSAESVQTALFIVIFVCERLNYTIFR
jgi:hypothetical protein